MLKSSLAAVALLASGAVAVQASGSHTMATSMGPASTASEATQWYRTVYAPAFIAGGEGFLKLYESQVYVGFGAHPGVYPRDQLISQIEPYIEPWVKAGWVTSELASVTARPIGKTAAIVTAAWRLKTKTGAPALKCKLSAWHYIVAKKADGWLVISEFEAPCADAPKRS